MEANHITYKQLDDLLTHLGFARSRVEPKWLRYEHVPSDMLIVLVDKKPTDFVRITDAVSAKRHLIEQGLISESELEAFLGQKTGGRKVAPAPQK